MHNLSNGIQYAVVGRDMPQDRIYELGAVIRGERADRVDDHVQGDSRRNNRGNCGGGAGGDSRIAAYKSRRQAFKSLIYDLLERETQENAEHCKTMTTEVWHMVLEVFPELYYETYPEDDPKNSL